MSIFLSRKIEEDRDAYVPDLLLELSRPELFEEVFAALEQKPQYLLHKETDGGISLAWLLDNRDFYSKKLRSRIRNRTYKAGVFSAVVLRLEKERTVYSMSPEDKIVESALSRCLRKALEPQLSSSLYSFRKGFSNLQALASLKEFLQTSRVPIYVLRRDIKSYDESMNREILLQSFVETFGEQDPYLWQLLQSYLAPTINETGKTLPVGIPSGISLAQVSENLYLKPLDDELTSFSQDFYCRFGDDIIFVTESPTRGEFVLGRMNEIVSKLKLEFSIKKTQNIIFGGESELGIFTAANTVDYLGLAVDAEGKASLPARKVKELKDELRVQLKLISNQLSRRKVSKEEELSLVISSFNKLLEQPFLHRHLLLVVNFVDDRESIKRLDLWIAKQVLKIVYGTAHDRVFRYISLRKLRESGLNSILQLKNLKLRGASEEVLFGNKY